MARRNAKTDDQPAESTGSGLPLAPRASQGVARAVKVRDENPTLDAVRGTLVDGPMAYDVPDEESAKKVVNYLTRAATELGVGLRKSVSANADGTWSVDFEATEDKRVRKYSSDEIRAWYGQTFETDGGPAELSGRIPAEVREAFKIANGFAHGETTLHGVTFKNVPEDAE